MRSLHVAVIGIDGSGKSTLARALPMAVAAEMNVVVGAAGEEFWVFGPDQDYLAPSFHPKGLPLAARLSRLLHRLAKRFARGARLYPYLKLAHLMFQDDAAVSIGRSHGCEVVVSDCNLILSAMGRAGNYKRGATRNRAPRERSTVEDLKAVFAYLVEGRPIPLESRERLPSLGAAGLIAGLARVLGFDGVWLPDVVIFLDVRPDVALSRIRGRGDSLDRHENEADMARARETYLKALQALEGYFGKRCIHVIDAGATEPRLVLGQAVAALRPHIEAQRAESYRGVLGTSSSDPVKSVLNAGYLFRYLLGHLLDHAWREPVFLLTPMGRQLLREGYSAGVMRVIYDQDSGSHGAADQIFLDYPLHRAVYDRLQVLSRRVEDLLVQKLSQGSRVRIFTAPSGFAYDLFQPLEAIAARRPELMSRVEVIAADLDPHGVLADELEDRAARLGIDLQFLVGDITDAETQRRFSSFGPYDVALFVGLSSWLPRSAAIPHLRWLHANLRDNGVLVTDCFSAAAYSLGGSYIGYRAHYYTPALYRCLLDYCGFDGSSVAIESGRDRINHVLIALRHRPEPGAARSASDSLMAGISASS
jgi:hypothetical protein